MLVANDCDRIYYKYWENEYLRSLETQPEDLGTDITIEDIEPLTEPEVVEFTGQEPIALSDKKKVVRKGRHNVHR